MPGRRRLVSHLHALHARPARVHRLMADLDSSSNSSSATSSSNSSDLCANGTSTSAIALEGFNQVRSRMHGHDLQPTVTTL